MFFVSAKKAGGKDDSSSESGEKKSSKQPKPSGTTKPAQPTHASAAPHATTKAAQPTHESAAPHVTTKAAQPTHESAAPHATTKAAGTAKPVKTSEFLSTLYAGLDCSLFQPRKLVAKTIPRAKAERRSQALSLIHI